MLRGLSILEPITGFSYDPEKTLSQSLEEIAIGLEPLPENLREVQTQLNHVADELQEIHPSLDLVVQDLSQFSDDTEGLSLQMNVIGQELVSLRSKLGNFTKGVATFGWISTIILSVFLALGAISNLSVFLVGNQMRTKQNA